jgi:hypothetical protein
MNIKHLSDGAVTIMPVSPLLLETFLPHILRLVIVPLRKFRMPEKICIRPIPEIQFAPSSGRTQTHFFQRLALSRLSGFGEI